MLRFCFLPIMLISLQLEAQTIISGKVKNNKGELVPGASITLKDSYDGATTDSLGVYRFQTSETGTKILLVTGIGLKSTELEIELNNASIVQDIQLSAEPNELTAVVITAGTFEASDTKRTTVLNPIDIVTTASANADITSAIRTLPGAQQVGENEGLFVRGGTAQETKVFIDGTLVNSFFFSSVPDIAQRGRFSPFLFKGTVFSSGGYSALYGGALSSALILESIDLPEQSSASAGLSTVGLSGGYQNLAKNKKSSWGLSYNYTNLAAYFAVVKQKPDNFRIPEFHNGEANFRIKTSKTGILKFYSYFNASRLGVRRPDIDSNLLKNAFGLNNYNLYANLSWKESLGRQWKINLGSSYSTNTDEISSILQRSDNSKAVVSDEPFISKSFDLKAVSELSTIKAVLEKRLSGLSAFRFGGEYLLFKDKNRFSNFYTSHSNLEINDHYKAGFAEMDIYVTNDLAAKIGGRAEHSSILGKANVVPRVSLAYKLGLKGQASLAYGTFYQKPEKDFFLREFQFDELLYTKATHYIANYQRVSRDYTFRAELFYKKYNDLVKTHISAGSSQADSISNAGNGYAQGLEFFWRDRKTIPNLDYWISYSYLDTKRDYLNFPGTMRPSFAATHTANLVVKKFVTRLKTQFNASYTFATGRPYYNIRRETAGNKFYIADQGKTIPFHSMSISVNYLPSLGKQGASRFTVFVLSVNNVLNSNQVFGYNYSYNGSRKEAIQPPARQFFFLGCFLSFGVDRSEDVINSNL